MKTLKNYILIILALFLCSSVSYGQIQVSLKKNKDKEKDKKEVVAESPAKENEKDNDAKARQAYAINPVTPQIEETSALPQDPEPPAAPTLTIAGSIDTYARTSFGMEGFNVYGPGTAFANLKGFSLGMANLLLSVAGEKSGFVADLVFGPRGRDAVFYPDFGTGSYTGQRIINQMYAYYKAGDVVTFNLGQFNTFLGYEVISPTLNFHYSTSYLFSWGPFNHTGFRTDFTFGNGMVAKFAIMNPTDMVEFNPVNTYTLGGQFGYANDAGSVYFNVLYGDYDGALNEDNAVDGDISAGTTLQVDLTTGWNFGESFYLGFNTSMQSTGVAQQFVGGENQDLADAEASSFVGAAIYPKLTVSENFAIGLRAEFFKVTNSQVGGAFALNGDGDGDVIALTLTGNAKVGGLTIIPEVRMDKTSENSFLKLDGTESDSMISLILAAVYKF